MDDYQSTELDCDLVMKGGIASGVVYPPAILELAKKYRFHGVGGASAGAIAAGAAAAAEYGRKNPRDGAGFRGLEEVRKELESGTLIPQLFEPAPETAKLFRFLTDLQRRSVGDDRRKLQGDIKLPGMLTWALRFVGALVHRAPAGVLLGAALIGGAEIAAVRPWPIIELARPDPISLHGAFALLVIVLSAIAVVLGGLLGGALQLKRGVDALRSPEDTFFGFCPGSRGPDLSQDRQLTDWLHLKINQMAGYDEKDRPLTIDELAEKGIDFKMVTTNVSLARPVILPRKEGMLFFHVDDMKRLFPPSVVDYLVRPDTRAEFGEPEKARNERAGTRRQGREDRHHFVLPPGFHPLPGRGKLPVIVAVRLSLSFPVLLSAVRLYTLPRAKYAAKERAVEGGERKPLPLKPEDLQVNWFSDGGIAANFPLSIFDRWMPSRPTFGINLCDGPLPQRLAGVKNHDGDVVRLTANETSEGMPDPAEIRGLVGLLLSMLDTARNARDNAQAEMASYRERVAHIFLSAHEGGLNLEMDAPTLRGMGEKGVKAANLFVSKDGKELFDFDEHRWVRLLLLMNHLEDELMTAREKMKVDPNSRDLPSAAQMEERVAKLFERQLERQGKEKFYRDRKQGWCDAAQLRMRALFNMIQAWDTLPFVHVPRAEGVAQLADTPPIAQPGKRFFDEEPPVPTGALRVTTEI